MKKLQILLTNPCNENWDDMLPSAQGHYCSSCEKHIIDLTNNTDAELIAFFKNKKDNVCGRLRAEQLNRTLVIPSKKVNWHWLFPVAIGASAITPLTQAMAQKATTVQGNTNIKREQIDIDRQLGEIKEIETIKGKVINEKGEPIGGVKVRMNSFRNVVSLTDTAGIFELRYERRAMSGKLSFEMLGFETLEKEITSNMVVTMKEVRIMLGAVVAISTNEPLYIITSGDESCIADESQKKLVKPEWIEKIDILKDAAAVSIYGAKGANGVLILKIKKKYADKINFSKGRIKK